MAAVELAEDVVFSFDKLIRCYEKLLDNNGLEENLNVISNCIENQQNLETQILEKSNECDRLRFSLNNTYEEMKRLHSSYQDLIQDYNLLMMNNSSSVEFLNFVIQCKDAASKCICSERTHRRGDFTANMADDSQSEDVDLIQRYETLLPDNIAKELLNHDEQKILEFELKKTNEECRHLKTRLEAAEKELIKTIDLLNVEKSLRKKVEIERDLSTCASEKLRRIFSKYEQHFSSTDRIIVINTLTNGKSTTELDMIIADYESEDTDWVLEVSPSPSKSTIIVHINDEMHDEIRDVDVAPSSGIENCCSSVQADSSSAGSLLVSSKSSQSQSVASEKHRYNTRESKKKTKLMNNAMSPKKPEVPSQTVINFSPQHKKDSDLRCDICNRHYSSKSNLSNHKRLVHDGIKPSKPHKCSKCNKTFEFMSHLKRHQLRHTIQKPFQCSICNLSFKHSCSRIKHERTIHGDGGVYCAYCNRKFANKENLIEHISTQHLPELRKPFKCLTCGKSFIRKYCFKKHQVVHISERTNKCSICEKCFKLHTHKVQHERTMHAELFRFGCTHCEKRYRTEDYLLRHIRKSHL